jgi:hypothetical protein
MPKERRAFNFYPENLRTPQNNRETFVLDDVLFEPENAEFVNGYIGDLSPLTSEDLDRTPGIFEINAERQKYQLTIGSTFINPETQNRESVAVYTDLVRQISANGGIVDDPNRIFSVNFYAWTPPIDYDKHINFGRYLWVGLGTADVNGEYVTKEPSHSQTTIYEFDGTNFIRHVVDFVDGLPAPLPDGTFVEDVSTVNRLIYHSNGISWSLVNFETVDRIPTSISEIDPGDFFYVARTGPNDNRPLVWTYSEIAGRWLAQPVVVSPVEPDIPREGMIWEDSRNFPIRRFKIFNNGFFGNLNYTTSLGPPGVAGVDGEHLYDYRKLDDADGWVRNNWWRHFEDLSPADREAITSDDQAIRPIIELWNGLESISGDDRGFRNDSPVYQKYAFDLSSEEIINTNESTTIFQYQRGDGDDDFVLGFPLAFNERGEFRFELTLETDESQFQGYKFFKDIHTGYLHSIWNKSLNKTIQQQDSDGLFDVPVNIVSNADHGLLTIASRSKMLSHMISNMAFQEFFAGSNLGLNSYRWTKKDPTSGAVLIDPEQSLLRALALLQRIDLDLPNAIRNMAKEYNKVLFRFTNKLNRMWDNLEISNGGTDTLIVPPNEVVDAIFTEMFVGRNEDFPFFFSDMGTYLETRIVGGIATVIDPTNPNPIYIPPSASRTGASPTFVPESFVDIDGITRLRGHDGVTIESFGDERDLVWLELQNRFFNAIPEQYKTETDIDTSRFSSSNFFLDDFYGNYVPNTDIRPVNEVVDDFNTVVGPFAGMRVFSKQQGSFATYDGQTWLSRLGVTDDIFLNLNDNEYYIFNGLGVSLIDTWNRNFPFDYTTNEFRQIIRREFERFIIFKEQDFTENTIFDENNPFTWNYRSAGVEGHYKGIYRRIYNTIRPHSHPWEVMGYKIEPSWWRTQYIPDSTETDGTPRYNNSHLMWNDFSNGVVNHPNGSIQRDQFILVAPIPVDDNGELLDPIAAGVIDIEKIDSQRLDDFWSYGDGAPLEQEFINSSFYPFVISLAGFLMKTGSWIDSLWSEVYIDIGNKGSNILFNAPHVIHRDTLTRPGLGVLPVHREIDADGNTVQRLGINAWISENVLINGGNPDSDFGRIMRNTTPALMWRAAGFVNEERTIVSTLSNQEIPFEDVHVILHKSQPVKQNFASGIIVIREGSGYRVFGYDSFNPFFRIERPAIPLVAGQVELRQQFVAEFTDGEFLNVTGGSVFPNKEVQHEFTVTEFTLPKNIQDNDTAKLAVLVNGLRLKPQHIQVLKGNILKIEDAVELEPGDVISVNVITAQTNPSTQTKQFFIKGVGFPYFATGSGQFENVGYGRFFETATEVINFMVGYGRAQLKEGWEFNELSEGGAARDWLLGAQRFARWVLETESVWNPNPQVGILDRDTFYYSPIQNSAKFKSSFGQIANVETIMNGAFGILNRRAEPIEVDQTFVSRIDDTLTVDRIDTENRDTEIFGLRANVFEAEHVVVFSNITKFNDIIYDPVLSLFHRTLNVDTYRTKGWMGRLEADGSILTSQQLLPNFEKQAFDLIRLHDRYNPVDDPVKRDQARNNYGFSPPRSDQYMVPIGADDRSRYDYYLGMIHTKGTVQPINAFLKGTRIGPDNFFIYEDWAWKLEKYGDTRQEIIQFRVEKNDFRDEVQVVFFGGPVVNTNNTIEIPDFDRSDIDNNPRWILPPKNTRDGIGNVEFPLDINGLIEIDKTKYFGKLFDTETGFTLISHVHFDPQLDKFDTGATRWIDFVQYTDPARYTDGPKETFSNELSWGQQQVGKLWWNTQRRLYVDYRSLIPDYEDMAKQWGRLLFFKANIIRTDEIVTIETLDPFGSGNVVNHGIPIGEEIKVTIRNADQNEYNLSEINVTSTNPSEFEFVIESRPDSPATGNPEIVLGAIDIFEWVESPVPPEEWETFLADRNDPDGPTGTVPNPEDPSFVTKTFIDDAGRTRTRFYFWIRNNSGINPLKDLTAEEIARRISNPTARNIPWFSPVDKNHMLIFTDGEKVQDGFGFEISIDQRNLETHYEWVLVSEGNQFEKIPEQVVDKIIDSLSGIDQFGNSVPWTLLSETERFGSCNFPPQSVFKDKDSALLVYIEALNRLLRSENVSEQDILTTIFVLDDEFDEVLNPTGFWKRTSFILEEYVDKKIFETVVNLVERDFRAANGFYAEDDLIRVVNSGNTDPWSGDSVAATYVFNGSSFMLIGIDNNTVSINPNIILNSERFRTLFRRSYNTLVTEEQNRLMFSLLNEMLIQNPICDWFFKTSYITTQIFTTFDKSPFVRANEPNAIISNIIDTKAFRTKFRGSTDTMTFPELEDVPVEIIEFPDIKIGLTFDRLSCNLLDDGGWDSFAWDTRELPFSVWDKPLWDFENLGKEEFYLLGEFTGDSVTTSFDLVPLFDPTLYDIKIELFLNNVLFNPEDGNIQFTIHKTHTTLRIETNIALSALFVMRIYQSQGFRQGIEPTIGILNGETLFEPVPSDYKHHLARLLRTGNDPYDPRVDMIGCTDINDPLGGRPEERIIPEVLDSVNIYVINERTDLYAGWDTTPWDLHDWDLPPADIGDRVFIITIGSQEEIPPGLEVLSTSEDIIANSLTYVPNEAKLVSFMQVEISKGNVDPFVVLTEGIHYDIAEPFTKSITFKTPEHEEFIADGATTSFQTTSGNKIQHVFLNGYLQTLGADYTLDLTETEITFVQPPPSFFNQYAIPFGVKHVGDGNTNTFTTFTDSDTLLRENIFAFTKRAAGSGGQNEIFEFEATNGGGAFPTSDVGAYWLFHTHLFGYYVWYNTGANTDPSLESRIGIEVAILPADTPDDIKSKTESEIIGAVSEVTVVSTGTTTFTVEINDLRNVPNPLFGNIPAPVGLVVIQNGQNPDPILVGGSSEEFEFSTDISTMVLTFPQNPSFVEFVGTGFNEQARTILIDGDFLYASGSFTEYDGTTRQRIAKVNKNTGALDGTFDTAVGFSSFIAVAMAIEGDFIYVGGDFTSYKGTDRQRIAKINKNTGALDLTFDTEIGFASGTVTSIVIDGDFLYVGGSFLAYKGTDRQRIAKINKNTGVLDLTFDTEIGFDNSVERVIVDGGFVYATGFFENYKGTPRQRIAKIDKDTGALDGTFDTAVGFNGATSVPIIEGNFLYVTGSYTEYKGTARERIAKIDKDTGVLDGTFDTATGFSSSTEPVVIDGDFLYVGGLYTAYKGTTRERLARIHKNTGVLDVTFDTDPGFNFPTNSIVIEGDLAYVSGSYTFYKAAPHNRIVVIDKLTADVAIQSSVLVEEAGDLYPTTGTGAFFTFSSVANDYYVWLNIDGGNVDPLVPGRIGVEVPLLSNDLPNAVAVKISAEIDALGDVTSSTVVPIVTVIIDAVGNVIDVADGAEPTGYTFVITQGINPTIAGFDTRLLPIDEYAVNIFDDVEVFTLVPSDTDRVLFYTMNNDIGLSLSLFDVNVFTAGAGQTVFNLPSTGFGVSERTFVFVDGIYQVLGTDYTHPAIDVVQFTNPLAGGERVEIRITSQGDVNATHVVVSASGTPSDTIPGLNDLNDPRRYMVFLDGEFQDGYATVGTPDFTVTDSNPDTLNWTITPTAGQQISIRMIRKIRVNQVLTIVIKPFISSIVTATFVPFVESGDRIRFRYNDWNVGSMFKFNVVSTPTGDYDVVNGILSFDTLPPPEEFITLNYTLSRPGDIPRSILTRMSRIVADVLEDHTSYDDPDGFNTLRPVGTTIVNTTVNRFFEWDGTDWVDIGAVVVGEEFFVTRLQEIQEFDGTDYVVLFTVGDTHTKPPVLDYPPFGIGIAFGTYAYGTTPDAAIDFPDAFHIMQHPGDSPP